MKTKKMKIKWLVLVSLASLLFLLANKKKQDEAYFNNEYAQLLGGIQEVKKEYRLEDGNTAFVVVDIETETEVIEGGLDKRSSLDSLQQALFFHHLTGKKPVVVIYDTDGREGRYEYRIKTACRLAEVEYRSIRLQ